MGVSSLRCWGICELLLKWNLNHKEYIFWLRPNVFNTLYFWFVFGMVSCLSRFFCFLKKMYNCIILFISFYFVPLEKKVNAFLCCKIICLGKLGQVFFRFSSQAVIPGNCNLMLYSKTMRSGTASLLFVCMKSTQLYWNRRRTAAGCVYTGMYTGTHEDTDTNAHSH